MKFDEIDDALEIVTDKSKPIEIENIKSVKYEKDDLDRDYEYTRGNLYSLIEKGQEAIDGIMEISQESGSARAYEVTGQIIKSVADATDKLLDLQKKIKDIKEPKDLSLIHI